MTPSTKRELISELAGQFWPAKLSGSLASIMDANDTSILNVDLFGFDKMHDVIGHGEPMQKVQAVLLPKDVKISVLVLDYSYSKSVLDLYYEVEHSEVIPSYADMSRAVDIILDSLTEQVIRDRFTAYESEFFAHTESTPADWHMSE